MKKTALFLFIALALVFTGCVSEAEVEPVADLTDMVEIDAAAVVELPVAAVKASGYQKEKGLVPEFAIDGDEESTWTASGKQWIELDLGAVKKVAYLEIAFKKGSEREYRLNFQGSVDGKDYFVVFNPSTSSGTTDEFEMFDMVNAEVQFIKINVNGSANSEWNNVREIKVYGVE